MYKSIRYIIPLVFAFACVVALKNLENINNFLSTNIATLTSIISPFFIGFIIAYILYQPIKAIEKKTHIKRGLSVLIVYGAIICTIIFAWLFIVPSLKSNINDLYASLPKAIEQVQNVLNNIFSSISLDVNNSDLKNTINDFITNVLLPITTATAGALSDFLINTTTVIVNYVVNIFLGIVISVYLLLSKEKAIYSISVLSKKILKSNYDKVSEFIRVLDKNIGVYLVAKASDSFIYGIICTIALAITGSKYALLLGMIAGLTNMIPFFGPIIGTAVAVIVNIFFSFKKALIVLAVMIIVQQLESAVLEPFFVGKQVGVPPIFTILAVTFASKYTGLLGILLSVPVTGVILMYINKIIEAEATLQQKEELSTEQ